MYLIYELIRGCKLMNKAKKSEEINELIIGIISQLDRILSNSSVKKYSDLEKDIQNNPKRLKTEEYIDKISYCNQINRNYKGHS